MFYAHGPMGHFLLDLVYWEETIHGTKNPLMHVKAHDNFLIPSVKSAQVEKLCFVQS